MKNKTFPVSQSQNRLAKLFNISFDEKMTYNDLGELFISLGLPKTGIPKNLHPSIVKTWSDEKFIKEVTEEFHMKEKHGSLWCPVCKEYHNEKKVKK